MNETRRLYFLPIVRRSFAYYLLTHQEVYLFLRGFVILLENLRLTFTANRNGKPQIYIFIMLFTGREVRIGRYLPEDMKMARGRRPRAIFMTEGKYFPIRTKQGR